MKNFVKCLGILIDSGLSWKYHTDYICHKVGKSIGIVDIPRHYIPRRLLFNIYHTFIAPYMNYGICSWGSFAQVYQKRLLVLQKTRFSYNFLGVMLENMQFPFLSKQNVFLCRFRFLMYDIYEQSDPTNILSQFTKIRTIHNYDTRSSSNESFYVKPSKTERMKKSFVMIGVSICNSIPYSVKSLSKSKFRNKIKRILLETLELENDHIEVSQLLNYFSNLC